MFNNLKLSLLLALGVTFNSLSQDIDSLNFKKKGGETSWSVLKKSVLTVPSDFKEMGLIFSKNWKKTSIVAGGIGTLVLVDKYTTRFYQDKIEKTIDYKLPSISPKIKLSSGQNIWPFQKNDTYLVYPIVGLYAGSLIANYETGQRARPHSRRAV